MKKAILSEADDLAQRISAEKDYTLQTYLLQVANILFKIRERELLHQNLSTAAAEMLFLVKTMNKDVTRAKISRMLLRERHAVCSLLMRMEKHGLIMRTRSNESRNIMLITLTAKGEKALEQANKMQSTSNVLSVLNAKQCVRLKQSLSILKEAGRKELGLASHLMPWP